MIYTRELLDSALPKDFVNLLPLTCETCGSETEITETLTMLQCSNPNCGEKAVQRLVALLKDLDVKNMGEAKCAKFLENYNINNPYCIFMYEPTDGVLFKGSSIEFGEAFYEQLSTKRTMLLWEYLKIGNLPGIRDSARKLLSEYDDLEEFYDDLEAGGIPFVQDLLGIKDGSKRGSLNTAPKDEWDASLEEDDEDEDQESAISVKAVKTYNTLIYFKKDLFEALDFVDIKKLTTPVINLCISTAVGKPYKSKKDFIHQMNELFGYKVHLNFLDSVSKDCQFLIWSKEGAETSKVKKAYKHNEKREIINEAEGLPDEEGYIYVMTGEEFRKYLEDYQP